MNLSVFNLNLPRDRREILRSISPDRSSVRTLQSELQDLFVRETDYRRALWLHEATDDDDYFESIYHCALLLYLVGDPTDVPMIWKAKGLNMDVGSGLDCQFLVGAGVDPTIAYLNENGYSDIVDYLQTCDPRDMTPRALKDWEQFRIGYFYGSSSQSRPR